MLLEIVIASDGSDDGTDAIVDRIQGQAGQAGPAAPLPRGGKAATLTAAVAPRPARSWLSPTPTRSSPADSIRELVTPFADPDVGGVAGDQRYLAEGDQADGIANGEQATGASIACSRRPRAAAGSVISATGAIYAIRRDPFRPGAGPT